MSIDPPDLLKNIDNDPALEEDLSFNEIESFSELILEVGLDIENAVPETDDPDSDNLIKKVEIFSATLYFSFAGFSVPYTDKEAKHFFYASIFKQLFPEIFTPPPKS